MSKHYATKEKVHNILQRHIIEQQRIQLASVLAVRWNKRQWMPE